MANDGRNGFRYGWCTSVYCRDTYCYTRLLLQFVKRGRERSEGDKKRKRRKQGFDTLGNVAIAFVFIVIGKITFIELDAYPRTMKWKREGRSATMHPWRHHNFLSRETPSCMYINLNG